MLTIQIQLWQDCNLNCTHCWRNAKFNNVKLDSQLVVDQLRDLIVHFSRENPWEEISISLTWGEITLYFERLIPFFGLLDEFQNVSLKLLTNGIFIARHLEFLRKYKDSIMIQISLDGMKDEHEAIRWVWTFGLSVASIRKLGGEGFKVRAQAVITEKNHRSLFNLLRFCQTLPIVSVWFRKMLDLWRAGDLDESARENALRNEMLYRVFRSALKLKGNLEGSGIRLFFWCDTVALVGDDPEFSDVVGVCGVRFARVLGIDFTGDVQLCPRFPISIGNVYERSLLEMYRDSYLSKYEEIFELNPECADCEVENRCHGGDLCEIQAKYGDVRKHKAPICPK